MSFDTYEGKVIGGIDDYVVTESNIRPKGMRFEASRQDGEPSLFGATIEDLRAEIDIRNEECTIQRHSPDCTCGGKE